MKFKVFLTITSTFLTLYLHAQNGVLKGYVKDKSNNESVIGANIILLNTDKGTVSDLDGAYIFEGLTPGLYDIRVSYLGYETETVYEIEVQGIRPTTINFEIKQNASQLDEILVRADVFKSTSESPVSLRNIGVSEIKRNPGGNRDISRVIQSLPGVTSTASFRNDLIIRGGAPNENRFFIDDVEVPNINHFATQGSSGGPAGLINVDFIREVDFYSGAFPVSRGNTLSSVFNFKLKDGRDDRLGFTATAGATDIGFTVDGPVGDKSTFLFSARRSYLQFLFKAIGLPFLPTYTDFNAKYKYKIDNKNEIYFIGIGSVDDFELNFDADDTESKQFLLNQLPVNTQWSYANGIVYKRYHKTGYTNFVLSRNMLNNEAVKYKNNDDSDSENLVLQYKSQEIENKFRVETYNSFKDWEYMIGGGYEYVKYNNATFNKIFTIAGAEDILYNADLQFHKYALFANVNRKFLKEKFSFSVGFRLDGNSYSDEMNNPIKQFSPRIALSYRLTENLKINFNTGSYYQLPPFTSLGYNVNERFVNRDNKITFINSTQIISGLEYTSSKSSRITMEVYYKKYNKYPFLIREQISLANLGGDFGVIGNEPVLSVSEGRAYGMEFLFQQRLYKGFYGIMAYTFGFSEFKNNEDRYIPSSWDSRHIVNLTLGKRIGKSWEVGVKWRYQDGLPNTPFSENSNLVINWDRNARGIPDFTQLNSLRNQALNTLDIRIDKKWFFKSWDLNLFLDIQNLTKSTISREVLILDRPLDANGRPTGLGMVTNPNAPLEEQRYLLKSIADADGTLLPTIGIVVGF